MSTQSKVYYAAATGHPIDVRKNVSYALPLSARQVLVAQTAATRVALHDGLDATGPLLWASEGGGRGTISNAFAPDDLPFKTACWVVITGAAEVWIYGK